MARPPQTPRTKAADPPRAQEAGAPQPGQSSPPNTHTHTMQGLQRGEPAHCSNPVLSCQFKATKNTPHPNQLHLTRGAQQELLWLPRGEEAYLSH